MLELKRPLAFFDLETTGLNVAEDRICSIAIHKLGIDGEVEKKYTLINPTIPIPKEASEVHKITDDMVKDKPTFRQLSKGIHAFLQDCDLGGYNMINYDLPLLSEEFARCQLMFPSPTVKTVDAGRIFHIKEPRTLESAYLKFCNKTMDDFHNAEADTQATYEVFMAQLEKYDDIGETTEEIHKFCKDGDNRADLSNKIVINEKGEYVFNFGKCKGQRVQDDVGFANWMLDKDFTYNTKLVVKHALEKAGKEVAPIVLPR
jgi:DNA polymerase-3 subunit epsilon